MREGGGGEGYLESAPGVRESAIFSPGGGSASLLGHITMLTSTCSVFCCYFFAALDYLLTRSFTPATSTLRFPLDRKVILSY